jgi:endoglucanase
MRNNRTNIGLRVLNLLCAFPRAISCAVVNDPLYQPPLHTSGRYIVDATARRFKLLSVNWYGGSDELFVPGGLDVRPRQDIANLIRSLGFNSVRLPYSDEMVLRNPIIAPSLLVANPDLVGMRAIVAFVAVVEACTDAGLAVVINDHITQAGWCDGKNLCDAGWSNSCAVCTSPKTSGSTTGKPL